VSACAAGEWTTVSNTQGGMCLTANTQCATLSLTQDANHSICSDCSSANQGVQRSDYSCNTACGSTHIFNSSSGVKYCKELDKQMTYVNNTGTTACTAKVTFAESFSVAKSEWSNAGFIINDIVDNANVATVFSHSITAVDGNADIIELLITFTNPSQFGNATKTLLFRLKAQNFGYPTATTLYAKVTAVSDTMASYFCPSCSGGTPYLEISSGTCVSTCASPKYIGLSAIKGKVCATSAECDTEGLTKHATQLLCRNTCNASGNGLQRSDLACVSACASASTFTSSSTAKYCKELDKQMTYVNNSGTTACTAKVTFAESFHVVKSEWSNAGFIINDIVDNANVATVFSHTITGIDGNAAITEL
jgi:uncharacterized protein (DUF302 family)